MRYFHMVEVRRLKMRRTSVMLEFSDEVYDNIVEPMKKNKSFSKLLATLTEGYLNDGYIRAFADDNLENMRKAAVDSFSKSIDSMMGSLSNMGLFTDELEATATDGKERFSKKAEEQRESLPQDSGNSSTDIEKLNSRMDSMQSIMNELLSVVKVLSEKFTGNVKMSVENVEKPINFNDAISSPVKIDVENVEKPKVITYPEVREKVITDEEKPDLSEEEKEADDFISSMLEGNSFVF